MTFNIEEILHSKRRLRLRLASLPISDKLHMLDELREREISIRASAISPDGSGISTNRLNAKFEKSGLRTQNEIDRE